MKLSKLFGTLAVVAALGACSKSDSGGTGATVDDSVKITTAKPPAGGDWSDVVNETAAGGIMMGDPNAKVKLIEIASLGCPFCRAFAESGIDPLVEKYVKTGQVSWEFRPYLIHGPVDIAADLIARCNGIKSFFPLVEAMYRDQPTWMGKVEAAGQDKLQSIQSLPPNQAFVAMADLAGLQDWAAMRGLPRDKSTQCLSDQKMIDNEVQVTSDVNDAYPEFSGTPSFVLNGNLLPKGTATWEKLEPVLQEAVNKK